MTDKLKFLTECSTEALQQVFDPAVSRELNCPLADYVLRMMLVELLSRGEHPNLEDPIIHRAFVGPDRCKHDRSTMGTCAGCDQEGAVVGQLYKMAQGFRGEARKAHDESCSTFGIPVATAYERAYTEAAEKVETLMRAIIEDDLPEEDDEEEHG